MHIATRLTINITLFNFRYFAVIGKCLQNKHRYAPCKIGQSSQKYILYDDRLNKRYELFS